MYRYKKAFIIKISGFLKEDEVQIAKLVKIPESERGDLSLPCFPFAKKLKKKRIFIIQSWFTNQHFL